MIPIMRNHNGADVIGWAIPDALGLVICGAREGAATFRQGYP